MKIKLPEKRFFSVAEVAARWEVEAKDVLHLIEVGDLKSVPKVAALSEKRGVSFYVSPNATEATRLLFNREELPDYIPGTLLVITYPSGEETAGEALDRRHSDMRANGDFEKVVMLSDAVEFEERCAADGSVPDSRPKIRDESLYAVIAALLASFPSGKQPSGKDLEKAASSVGVSISDDTIRKALKAAREMSTGLPAA